MFRFQDILLHGNFSFIHVKNTKEREEKQCKYLLFCFLWQAPIQREISIWIWECITYTNVLLIGPQGKVKIKRFSSSFFQAGKNWLAIICNHWQPFAIICNHWQLAIIGNWQSFAIIGNPPSLFWLTTESWLLSLLSAHFLFLLHSEGFCHKINIHVFAAAFGFRTDTHHVIN